MSTTFEEIKKQTLLLPKKEKAELAAVLIEDLNENSETDVEELWRQEIRSRYEAYKRGELQAYPVEDVLARIREEIR